MKKSLIALAVMAVAGAASAQSSVQLYGIADVWVGGVKATGTKAQTVVESGGVSGSRWGLKGSEDLGGGLKAIFTLEQGFALDTGAAAAGFNREASVGVAGGFGEVKLGKVWTAYDDVQAASNPVFDSALTPSAAAFASTTYLANPSNGIKYTSPAFSGFTGVVSYAFDEKTAGNSEVTAVALQYANGPLAAAVAYQTQQAVAAAKSTEFTNLNASYNLGVVTLKGVYAQRDDNAGSKDKEYQIGVDYPVAANLILSAAYASSENKLTGVKQSDNSGLGLAAAYLLSKRTTAYAGVRSTKLDKVVGTDVTTNLYAVGVKHVF
jgi:predicted porin